MVFLHISSYYLSEVFLYLARNTGKKIKYSNINNQVRSNIVKKAIESLVLARISHRVYHSQEDEIPLGAEIKPEHFKTTFVDIGLSNRICDLDLTNTLDMLTIRPPVIIMYTCSYNIILYNSGIILQ